MIFLIIGRYDGETNVIEKGVWHHARLLRQASRRLLRQASRRSLRQASRRLLRQASRRLLRNTLIIIYTAFSLDRPSCLLAQ